jgi:Uncharacterised nucleotidyltransferase
LGQLVPATALSRIRFRYQENARKALWFTNELFRILDCLEWRGIEAVAHKGPVLAHFLYGDLTSRESCDLDILVRPADVIKAKQGLAELGYRPSIEITPRQERAYIEAGYEYAFDAPYGRNLLEIQWQILPRFYAVNFDLSVFFARAETITVGNRRVRMLCAQDLFLVLCVHAAKHVWWRLSWLCDIAQLLTTWSCDCKAVINESRRLGIERIVGMNLWLAEKLLGWSVPLQAVSLLKGDPDLKSLADEVMLLIAESRQCDTESLSYFRLMMQLRERWQDGLHFLLRLACTANIGEWKVIRLPEPLFNLYGVVRLFRLTARLVRRSSSHLRAETADCSTVLAPQARLRTARNDNVRELA